MSNGLTGSNLLAGVTELLEGGGYRRAGDDKLGDWQSPNVRLFEDAYGIVAVVVYETTKQLLSEWTEAQSALVVVISKYVARSDAKASEGYLVLLTSADLSTTDRDAAMRIRYDTGRVRKLLGTGEDLRSLQDLQTIVAPLLPLVIGQTTSSTESSLDVLPGLLADQGLSESAVRTLVDAYQGHELLVEALYKGLP